MLIGRTRKGIEKENPDINLSASRYYYLSNLSRKFLIKNSVCELPVKLSIIIKNNGWCMIPYSKLKELDIFIYNDLIKKNLGFAELRNKKYYIYYDDNLDVEVQRFTIAHEIGHIMLHHFDVYHEKREQEANMFAARILMPMCVLYECDVQSVQEIAEMCKVSVISAGFRFKRLQMLKRRNKFYTDITEKEMKRRFNKFIKITLEKKNSVNN